MQNRYRKIKKNEKETLLTKQKYRSNNYW